jgi:hypothetical protein
MRKISILTLLLIAIVGCGGSSGNRGEKIDMSDYLPKTTTKEYTQVSKSINNSRMQSFEFTENISIEPNMITLKVDNNITSITTVHKDKIAIQDIKDDNRTIIMKREVRIGDKVIEDVRKSVVETLRLGSQIYGDKSIQTEESCILEGRVENFAKYFYLYENYDEEHDIIKLKCSLIKTEITSIKPEFVDELNRQNGVVEFKPNTSYIYLQKGIGTIATIDDDCVVEKSPETVIDDMANPVDCIGEQYNYILYHPEY